MKLLNSKIALLAGFAIAAVLATSSLVTAQAAEFIVPTDNGNVTVSSNEQHRNLYVFGGNVLVNSNTAGDLYIAGGNVTIEGDVEGDLTLAGGTAYVNGTVGGDVRAVGGNVNLNDAIAGDLVIAGGTVILNEKATVGGDLFAAGGEITVLGAVGGKASIRADRLTINSAMPGNVDLKVQDKLFLGAKTVFGNTAKYKSTQEAQVENGAQLGGLQFERMTARDRDNNSNAGFIAGMLTLGFVIKLLATIITALILHRLFRRTSKELIHNLAGNFWMNLLIGLIAIVATPIIAVLLMFSVVGFYIALILLVLWLLLMLISCLLGTVFVGAWLVKLLGKKPELVIDWQAIVIGVVVVCIVGLIPFIGMLVIVVLMLAAMGTLVRGLYMAIKRNQDDNSVIVDSSK
jgi:cytoskeletal protein CcmA (bactofilin family)